jgi:hypothetical protein
MPARPGDAMAVAILNPGAGTFVVVRGDGDVEVLLLEPASTVNTGTAGGERTREVEWV